MSAATAAFVAAVDTWNALLRDGDALRMMEMHFDTVMAMAVALAQPNAQNAFEWDNVRRQFPTDEEEQTLLALVFAIQEILEIIVRDNMTFIISESNRSGNTNVGSEDSAASASQRETAAQQEALVARLPERFRLAFIKTTRSHWASLNKAAVEKNVRIAKLSSMNWRVVRPYVLMRIITSDTKQRIIKVPMQQFHRLRYSTAKVLQEMNQVEAHPIMRLTNMEQNKPSHRSSGDSIAPSPAQP